MKNSLWIVIVVVVAFTGFLVGYSVSSYTGIQKVDQGSSGGPEAGGYGGESGGYGTEGTGRGEEAVDRKVDSESFGERTGYFGD